MTGDDLKQLEVTLAFWLALALPAPLLLRLGLGTWDWRRLLPPRRTRAVPWTGFEVVFLFLATFLFWPRAGLDFVNWLLGTTEPQDRFNAMLGGALVVPFQVLTILLVPPRLSGTRLYQLGITAERLRQNLLLGYLGCLVLLPPVYFVNVLVQVAYVSQTGEHPLPHPLQQLVQQESSPLVWLVVWFMGVVAAPLLEESIFRGVILFWLPTRPWASHVVLGVAVVLSAGQLQERGPGCLLFTLALVPVFFLLPPLLRVWAPPTEPTQDRGSARRRLDGARAVYASAALFASVHPWPTPVALFLLGLGLGWLAYRTRSLVGPMVLHALFNTAACLELWLVPPQGP